MVYNIHYEKMSYCRLYEGIDEMKAISDTRVITNYMYSAFFAFGFSTLILSSALPAIARDFSLNHLEAGFLLASGVIGYIGGAIFCVFFADRLEIHKLSLLSSASMTIGLSLMTFSFSYISFIIANIFANFGTGIVEVAIGVIVSRIKVAAISRALNRVHSLFALGAVGSPFIVALFISLGLGWRLAYLASGVVSALPFIFILKMKRYNPAYDKREEKHVDFKRAFSNPLFILLNIMMLIYVGYEMGYSAWISTLMFEYRNFPIALASTFPAIFWFGMFVGRYSSSYLAGRFSYTRWLLIIVLLSLITSILSFVVSSTLTLAYLFVYLSGVSFASTYPTIQAILVANFKEHIGSLMGTLVIFVGLGSVVVEWGIGAIANYFGILAGVILIPVSIALEIPMISKVSRLTCEKVYRA